MSRFGWTCLNKPLRVKFWLIYLRCNYFCRKWAFTDFFLLCLFYFLQCACLIETEVCVPVLPCNLNLASAHPFDAHLLIARNEFNSLLKWRVCLTTEDNVSLRRFFPPIVSFSLLTYGLFVAYPNDLFMTWLLVEPFISQMKPQISRSTGPFRSKMLFVWRNKRARHNLVIFFFLIIFC